MADGNANAGMTGVENGKDDAGAFAMMSPMMNGAMPLMQYWMASNMELFRLAATRATRDAEAMSEFMRCQSPEQFTSVCARVASEAAEDYADSMKRLMTIGTGDAASA